MIRYLSENFTQEEFECKCKKCNFVAVNGELLLVLEDLRRHLNTLQKSYIKVNSGNRCYHHNKREGGAEYSQHIYGNAADVEGWGLTKRHTRFQIDPVIMYNYLIKKYPGKYGIGIYSNRVHIDVRKKEARWDKR